MTMNAEFEGLILLCTVWVIYFAIHSLLAGVTFKGFVENRWPDMMIYYRAIFNCIALLLLIPPFYLSSRLNSVQLWEWHGHWAWFANTLAGLAALGILSTLRGYDGFAFLGFRQIKKHSTDVESDLNISFPHRFVRHPWYFFALVIIWTRNFDQIFLVTASMITLYFIIGSRLEEKKLITIHGQSYRNYQKKVPGLIPGPWRYLDENSAREIEQKTKDISN